MSFALDDDQKAIRDLARQIFANTCDKDALDKTEAAGGFFSAPAWKALSESGLVAMAVPEAQNGGGLGLIEQCLVLRQAGEHVAPVPLLESSVVVAPTLAIFAPPAVTQARLTALMSGESIATCALADADSRDPLSPTATAEQVGDGWVLTGCKPCVPFFDEASSVLVAATDSAGPGLWLMDLDQQDRRKTENMGFSLQRATDSQPLAQLELQGTPAVRIGGAAALQFAVTRAMIGRCALALGVSKMALRLTAEHCRGREQFGKPIGTFQAVTQRAGDMFIHTQTMELAMLSAAWRLNAEPTAGDLSDDALEALWTARYWATEAGHHVVAAAQHLHGGTGFDRDYPVYRCFLRARRLELGLGTASESLAALGASY